MEIESEVKTVLIRMQYDKCRIGFNGMREKGYEKMIRFYRKHPDIFAERHLGCKLSLYQKILIRLCRRKYDNRRNQASFELFA